jgi:hypothetical protein
MQIENPEHGSYSLTKAGYVRAPGSVRTGGRGPTLKHLFAYIINRFKKKDFPNIPMVEIENLFKGHPELMDYLWDMDKMKDQIIKNTGLADPRGEEIKKMGLSVSQIKYLDRGVKKSRGNWSFNETTGRIDIMGSFVSPEGLKGFRGIRFGTVTGDFDCYSNNLTSLEGAPQKVGGDFRCHDNNLTSLVGGPTEVHGSFYCYRNNNIVDLNGSPKIVGGHFRCADTGITSLDGITQNIGRDLNCANTPNLKSLKGAPAKINGIFDCSYSGIISLEGAPDIVVEFRCEGNSIISMKGCPDVDSSSPNGGRIDISKCNNLISLEGIANNIEMLNMGDCKNIKSLDGIGNTKSVNVSGCENLADLSSLKNCETFTFSIPKVSDYTDWKRINWNTEGWLYGLKINPKMFASLFTDPDVIIPVLKQDTKGLIAVYPYLNPEIQKQIEIETEVDFETVKNLKDLEDLGFF